MQPLAKSELSAISVFAAHFLEPLAVLCLSTLVLWETFAFSFVLLTVAFLYKFGT